MRAWMLVTALLVVMPAGCGDLPWFAGSGGGPDLRGEWRLVAGEAPWGPLGRVADFHDHGIRLVIEEDEFEGRAVCNHYRADYERDGHRMQVRGVKSTTEVGCGDGADVEKAYLDALGRVDRVERDGNGLVLTGAHVALRYDPLPGPDADLEGTVWRLESLIEGQVASSTLGSQATLVLGDGSLRATTGCRDLRGEYTVEADRLRVSALSADGRCDEDLARQDEHLLQVLGANPVIEINGQRLRLTTEGGGLHYVAGEDGEEDTAHTASSRR